MGGERRPPFRERVALIRPRADGLTLAIAAISAAALALALFRQSAYGPGLNQDTIHFIAMARSLLDGDGLRSWDGAYYGQWGPLAAISFAAFGFGLADPHSAAGPLNAAAFGLSVLVAGIWLRRRVKSAWLILWACACMVLAFPLVEMSAWAYSEPGFILTGTLALFFADKHFEDGKRSSLLLAAAFAGLTCVSRYMGISLLLTVAALLALRPGASLRERLGGSAAFALIGATPICLWALRNYLTVGFFLRYQDSSDSAVWEWVVPMMATMSAWWTPFVPVPALAATGATMAAIAAVGALTTLALVRWLRTGRGGARFVLLTTGYSFAYMGLLLWGMTIGSHGMYRFLAPLFIPMTMAAAFFADKALALPCGEDAGGGGLGWARRAARAAARARSSAWLAPSAAVALALWMAYGVYVSARYNWTEATNPTEYRWRGWNYPPWADSETAAYMKERAPGGLVLSNIPWLLYITSDQPEMADYRRIPEDADSLATALSERYAAPDETLAAWFHHYTPTVENYDYNATRLRTMDGLEPAASLYDGDIFRLNPNYKAPNMPSGETPAIASSRFDVYMEGGALIYEKSPCAPSDVEARFFVRALPMDLSDLPPESAADGYGDLDFDFLRYGAVIGDRCVIRRPLPNYALRGVEVGQWIIGGAILWSAIAEFPPDDSALAFYRSEYARIAAAEPTARAEYDVYLQENALIYLKDGCEDSHARGRFLLSAFPQNAKDLPQARRETGHDALNFDFARYGVRFDGKCLLRRPLPDYPITAVETGRWLPGEREIWRLRLPVGD